MLLWQSVCTPAGVALEVSHGRRTLPACGGTQGSFKSKAQNKGSYSGSQPSVKSRVVYANTYRARAPGKEMSCRFPGSKF